MLQMTPRQRAALRCKATYVREMCLPQNAPGVKRTGDIKPVTDSQISFGLQGDDDELYTVTITRDI